MLRKIMIFLGMSVIMLVGTLVLSVVFSPESVWKHIQDIETDEYFVLEIVATKGWQVEERWRIYTLDMMVDPSSRKRPIVALGHEEDLRLTFFKGSKHNDKYYVQDGVLEESHRMVYRVPIDLLSKNPARIWLWSGNTGYIFKVNGIQLKEKATVHVREDDPYIYYVLRSPVAGIDSVNGFPIN